jgi:endonuclease/exonuclease/phosphatase family metal-dependent hydrolase
MTSSVTDRPGLVRVASWNLWWRFGPWERRRDAIAAVLADARPDVIGLQEVWAGRVENQAAYSPSSWGCTGLGRRHRHRNAGSSASVTRPCRLATPS